MVTICLAFLFILPSIDFFNKNKIYLSDNKWQNFNDIDIPLIIKNNKIVFLDITADWCITCQFNKINVINSKKISNLFNNNNIVLVRADWTKPNKEIDTFLKKYNKFGIPFNALYSSTYPEGLILSEILTQNEIINNFEKISK